MSTRIPFLGSLLLLALAQPLSAQSQGAESAALESFLRASAQESEPRFAAMAERLNPYQLPLVSLLVNAKEREHGIDANSYEALVRWHFWLARQLDTQGQGMWSLRAFGRGFAPQQQRRDSAIVAALQRIQLRALAEMATRRGRTVDALAWWREERLVEQRMIERLYDPVLGGYVDVDSLGTRIAGSADLRSLIVIGLGAPTLSRSGANLAQQLLTAADVDSSQQDQLALLLDPVTGWAAKPGAAELGLELDAFFLRRGVGLVREQKLASAVEARCAVYGVRARTANVQLGSLQLPLDESAFRPEPFPRSDAALEFLSRARLVPPAQVSALRTRIDRLRRGECPPDSVGVPLLRALADWRQRELEPNLHSFLREGEKLPEPVNGEGSGAFRYLPSDLTLWTREALLALTQDLLAKHLSPRHDSPYTANAEPRSIAIGGQATLQLTRTYIAARTPWPTQGWRAAWSDGSSIRPSTELTVVALDSLHAQAQLSSPPSETGMWWLVLTGPLGAPQDVSGVSVVEPLLATLAFDGGPAADGSQRLRISLENHTLQTQRGKLEIDPPAHWQIVPAASSPFEVAPSATAHSFVTLLPEEAAGPGQYSMRVRVISGGKLYQEFQHELAIPFQWISLGSFAASSELGIDSRSAGDEVLDLAGKYNGLQGPAYWSHLAPDAMLPAGWIRLVGPNEPRGLRYARTVLSTSSREILVQLESSAPTELLINGRSVLRSEGSDGIRSTESSLDFGSNHIVVKLLAGAGSEGRFRLSFRDIEGGPIRTVENRLDRMLDGYAAVRGASALEHGSVDRFLLVPIVYQGKGIQSVSVVGNFNGWSPAATPMRGDGEGRWKAEIRLPLGRFEYKLAINGIRWIADPTNPLAVPDGFGGKNSLLVLE